MPLVDIPLRSLQYWERVCEIVRSRVVAHGCKGISRCTDGFCVVLATSTTMFDNGTGP